MDFFSKGNSADDAKRAAKRLQRDPNKRLDTPPKNVAQDGDSSREARNRDGGRWRK
jgi:hypothetical protein